jgi:snurportin-1
VVPPQQAVVLSYRGDGTVATADEPPVVLGRMPADWVAATGAKLLRPGRLLRFSVGAGGLAFQGGRPSGADLRFEGPANQRRGRADAFSKVLFQALARAGEAPTLEQLQRAAAGAAAAGDGDADMAG